VLEAFRDLDPVSPWDPESTDGYLSLTSALHMLGRHREELALGQEACRTFPAELETRFTEIRALIALGRSQELQTRLEEALARGPGRGWTVGEFLLQVSHELEAHQQSALAQKVAERAVHWFRGRLARETRTEATRVGLARAFHSSGALHQADSVLALLLENAPGKVEYLGHSGVLAAALGDRDGARHALEELSGIGTPYAFGAPFYWRAAITAHLGDLEVAAELLVEAFGSGRRVGSFIHADINLKPLWHTPAFRNLVSGGV
jgi:tetratricopeptide (TPR) repeat protein